MLAVFSFGHHTRGKTKDFGLATADADIDSQELKKAATRNALNFAHQLLQSCVKTVQSLTNDQTTRARRLVSRGVVLTVAGNVLK